MEPELINIIDEITLPNVISDTEAFELQESACHLIQIAVFHDPMQYIQPNFHEALVAHVHELLMHNIDHVYDFDVSDEVHDIVEQAADIFYTHICPPRSYDGTFIRYVTTDLDKMRDHIQYLKDVPQPDQRTQEWYEFRYRYLTASSIWKAFVSESTRNQLIYEKCKPLNTEKYAHVSTGTPMHWGHKYEPLSILLYEDKYKTTVGGFGCIPHKTLGFLAASPDGINVQEDNALYGRMVEVKNIWNREITGTPKLEYWIQMQVQMEVCELNECDFLETRFKEYDSLEEFELDTPATTGPYNVTANGMPKGVFMYFVENGEPKYVYPPLSVLKSKESLEEWEQQQITTYSHLTWVMNIYWRLDQLSCVLVLRNKCWFRAAEPILTEVWEIILKEKVAGYEHRAPTKRAVTDESLSCPYTVIKLDGELNTCIRGYIGHTQALAEQPQALAEQAQAEQPQAQAQAEPVNNQSYTQTLCLALQRDL